MANPRSSIFHFTSELENLVSILGIGFVPNYLEENIEWLGFKGREGDLHLPDSHIGIPMVCFRDLVLEQKSDGLRNFGEFGLGLRRDWAKENGVRPVTYVSPDSEMADSYKKLGKINKDEMRDLVVFTQISNYSEEQEWRYVPQNYRIPKYLVRETMTVRKRLLKFWQDRVARYGRLEFESIDIEKIVVETDDQIPGIQEEIERIFADSTKEELQRLKLRVTSMEYTYRDY